MRDSLVGFSRRFVLAVRFTFVAVALAGVGGCLISSSSNTRRSGTNVPESTFMQVEPGKTTVGWVQATLGDPTSKTNSDDHQVWKYTYTERTDSSGAVFLIFGGSSSDQTTRSWFIEFKDGVVLNKWRT